MNRPNPNGPLYPGQQAGYPMQRYCPRCGNIVSVRICPLCGYDTAMPYPPAQPISTASSPFPNGDCPPVPPGGGQPSYGAYPPFPAQTPERKPKRSKAPYFAIGGVVLFFLAVFFVSLVLFRNVGKSTPPAGNGSTTPPSASNGYYQPNGVSLEEFYQLSEGMTYARASKIIGGDGTLVESGERLDGTSYYTYGWVGENNPYAEVYLTFQNDVISEITSKNLLPN